MSGCVGTMRYMAPEIFSNKDNYDLKIDIYSLSLNFWFMCTAMLPYEEIIHCELFKNYIIEQLSNISLHTKSMSFQFSSSPYNI